MGFTSWMSSHNVNFTDLKQTIYVPSGRKLGFYLVDDERRLEETVQSAVSEFEKGRHRGGHLRLKGG